jgi:uncharacterized membrane protein
VVARGTWKTAPVDGVQIVATWLHTVAFVIAWGYYGILGRMIIPGLERTLAPEARADALLAIERRALPLMLLSIALFTVTGSYLLVTDSKYEGLGNIGNAWAAIMLGKHLLVVVLIGLGVVIDRLIRWAAEVADDRARAKYLGWLRWCAEGATGVGALIALLTVAAQASS